MTDEMRSGLRQALNEGRSLYLYHHGGNAWSVRKPLIPGPGTEHVAGPFYGESRAADAADDMRIGFILDAFANVAVEEKS